MNKNFHNKVISFLGIYFFILGIIAVIYAIYHPETANFLWFCYIFLILAGLGMILRNSLIIISQLNISLIPTLIWNIDFFYQLITKSSLWGVTDYFFVEGVNSLGMFITLQHLYILPLTLYSVYVLGLKSRKAWIISFVEIFIIFWLSFLFTSFESNTNCVFESCVSFLTIEGISYRILWFVFVFVTIFLVNKLFVRMFIGKNYPRINL